MRTMNPQLRRSEIFDALRRLLLRAAEERPQVLVFEDLHWMDQATEEFLTFIADSLPTSRVLCLFTYRPGYVHPFGDRTYHTRIVLPTLSTADTVQMAQAMLAAEHLPDELVALIVQKAEGNPFFVEEVVKSLQETGAIRQQDERYVLARPLDDIVVPDTIQDVLMARIDRLAEAPKQALPNQETATGSEMASRKASPSTAGANLAWVVDSLCGDIPDVAWWRFKTHGGVARYVARNLNGDWSGYVAKWRERLDKIKDIQSRNSTAVTNTGVSLGGEVLDVYVGQMSQRLNVLECLAREAALAAKAGD